MRLGDDFDQSLFAGGHDGLQVTVQHCCEGLLCFPIRMHWRHRFCAIEREGHLDIHRLFDPKRAVVIEGRDALVDRNEERSALCCDARDKIEDRSFGSALVPGR
jgi:hypothetical protein